ncbi:MAG: transposase [Acutalibacteraceae bacterium]|nr:transposase [Acutalibacteraceae bacterium]
MYRKVKADVRDIFRTLCSYKKVEIIDGAVCRNHVHLCVSISPQLSLWEFAGYLILYKVLGKGL